MSKHLKIKGKITISVFAYSEDPRLCHWMCDHVTAGPRCDLYVSDRQEDKNHNFLRLEKCMNDFESLREVM